MPKSSGTPRVFQDLTSSPLAKAVFLLTLAGFLFSIWAIFLGFRHGPYEFHTFRQTQTAITAEYLENGGPFLKYETPVLGPPWSIPFEFPLYQWIVAFVAKHFSANLDETGRAVSIFFFYASFFPLASILRRLRFRPRQIAVILVLVAASPLYIFVSRLFMIESTALFFSIAYVDQVFRLTLGDRPWQYTNMVLAAVFGTLAGLVKVTTFLPYMFWPLQWQHSSSGECDAPGSSSGVGPLLSSSLVRSYRSSAPHCGRSLLTRRRRRIRWALT